MEVEVEVEDVENQPQKKKLFQSKCDAEVGISPTSQLAMTDKKRAKRRSTTLDVKLSHSIAWK